MRAWILIAAAALTGCFGDVELRVEMTPEGAGVRRTLARDGGSGELPAYLLREVVRGYPGADARAASGLFADELPGEFGGAGFLHCYASDLGSARIYCETVQRSDSPWERVQALGAAIDRCIDLYAGWVRWELERNGAGEPATRTAPLALLAGLEEPVRARMKDVALALSFGPEERAEASWPFLLLEELLERRLLTLAEVPEILRRGRELDDEDTLAAWGLARLRRTLATELELAEDAPELAFLRDEDALVASWRTWIAAGGGQDQREPPEADSEPGSAIAAVLELCPLGSWFSLRGELALTLELRTPVAPLCTNGTFDPSEGVVRWPKVDLEAPRLCPLFRYALWAEPDEAFQRARFGTLVLQGEELVEYALWYADLGADRVAEWSRLLAGLTPERDALEPLARFRFSGRPAEGEDPGGMRLPRPERGAELLLAALRRP